MAKPLLGHYFSIATLPRLYCQKRLGTMFNTMNVPPPGKSLLNPRYLTLIAAIMLCPVLTLNAAGNTPPLAYEQATELTRAVGKVLAKQRTTETLLRDCGTTFTALQQPASQARAHWQSHNADMVAQATRLRAHLVTQLAQQHTTTNATQYAEQIDYLIDSNVRGIQEKLAQYPPAQRQPLCHRLMLSITAGDWDIAKALPEAQQIITRYLATQLDGP